MHSKMCPVKPERPPLTHRAWPQPMRVGALRTRLRNWMRTGAFRRPDLAPEAGSAVRWSRWKTAAKRERRREVLRRHQTQQVNRPREGALIAPPGRELRGGPVWSPGASRWRRPQRPARRRACSSKQCATAHLWGQGLVFYRALSWGIYGKKKTGLVIWDALRQ